MSRFSFTSICAALLAASTVNAQTYTSCNPMEKSTFYTQSKPQASDTNNSPGCPADPALGSTIYVHDFTKDGADDSHWTKTNAGDIKYTSEGAVFTINKEGDSPTLMSNFYLFFGSVSFHMRAAPGQGIISSAILQSDDLDEVDWEWIGGVNSNVQTNYFGKANTTAYDREVDAAVQDAQGTTHNYTIAWTAASITWLIDSVPRRTLRYADALGGKNFPQTPANIRIGPWAGGAPGQPKGTVEWAGGATDFSKAPFSMILEKIEVINLNPGKEYVYGDRSGSWESIKVVGGGDKVNGQGDLGVTASASAKPTLTTMVSSSATPDVKPTLSLQGGHKGNATTTGGPTSTPTGGAKPSGNVTETNTNAGNSVQGLGWGSLVLAVSVVVALAL